MNMRRRALVAALPAGLSLARPAVPQAQTALPGASEIRALAEEAFIYGLPIVMNYGVMYEYAVNRNSSQFKAPFNQIHNEARVFTPADTAVIGPNSDTPYSVIWCDLRAEPLVISVPAVERSRYYSLQLCDSNLYNYGYIGSRATGSEAGDFLVAGPDWQGTPPAGVRKVFRASTQFGIIIARTQLFGPDDMPNVVAVQRGYRVRTLSAFLNQPAPPAAPVLDFPSIDRQRAQQHFFDYLHFMLHFAPAQPNERALRVRLAHLGVGAGRARAHAELPPEVRAAAAEGARAGSERIVQAIAQAGLVMNGWRVSTMWGDAAFFDGNWLLRAAGARAGIYGNSEEEAAYPLTRNDSTGQPLDGSRNRYTMTFPTGQLPPVNAFWSVTMYDGRTELLVANPIDRYLINSPMLPGLKRNADGSLTLHIQHADPGPELRSNWLPAPDGPIYMALRLYWPKTGSPSILPIGRGDWQPPGLMRVG